VWPEAVVVAVVAVVAVAAEQAQAPAPPAERARVQELMAVAQSNLAPRSVGSRCHRNP
jgi:hypothetical protein